MEKGRHGSYSSNTEHCFMTSDVARCRIHHTECGRVLFAAFTHHLEKLTLNDVRYRMFQRAPKTKKSFRQVENVLNNTSKAHTTRLGVVPGRVPIPEIESLIGSGWYEDATRRLHPHVSVDDPLPNEFTDIVCCKCKNCAASRCSCRAKNLKYIAACTCNNGVCHNPYSVAIETDSE
ncbi:hypothetical protein GWK47_012388 [Chionoecetes opilio]|uniref:Tesmin/TSO1-like CXC domain-containing protein n=1 Tax=Chionoecetes opilio TaxID=41210 RepID=A0A8J5CPG7_CHIOP|nr:hypothetical protein GWK47_012388 [Chionoecetes opilio]